jgi:hypothetical protein
MLLVRDAYITGQTLAVNGSGSFLKIVIRCTLAGRASQILSTILIAVKMMVKRQGNEEGP